jgi:hypothetical protein
MPKLAWIFSLLISHSTALSAGTQEAAAMSAKPEVVVTFQPTYAGGKLKIRYSVVNKTDAPVVVFDRMRNLRTGEPDPNWAFVDIAGHTAVLKRAMEPTGGPVMMENIPEPYAREIVPGGTVAGSFTLPTPLNQSDPYGKIPKGTLLRKVEVDKMEMWVGWCPKAKLKAASREATKIGDDLVWIPSYLDIELVQKIAKSAPSNIRLPARAATTP